MIDRVIDVGGEVFTATVDHGSVRLLGRLGERRDIPFLNRLLHEVDGVTDVYAQFTVSSVRERETARG